MRFTGQNSDPFPTATGTVCAFACFDFPIAQARSPLGNALPMRISNGCRIISPDRVSEAPSARYVGSAVCVRSTSRSNGRICERGKNHLEPTKPGKRLAPSKSFLASWLPSLFPGTDSTASAKSASSAVHSFARTKAYRACLLRALRSRSLPAFDRR